MKKKQTNVIEEIKPLVIMCYLLEFAELTENQLNEIATLENTMTALEVIDVLTTVENRKLATLTEKGTYKLTDFGQTLSREFKSSLTYELREKLQLETMRVLKESLS